MHTFIGPVRVTPARLVAVATFIAGLLSMAGEALLLPKDPLGLVWARHVTGADSCEFVFHHNERDVSGRLRIALGSALTRPLALSARVAPARRLVLTASDETADGRHEFTIGSALSDSGPVPFSWPSGQALTLSVGGLAETHHAKVAWEWLSAADRPNDSSTAARLREWIRWLQVACLIGFLIAAWLSPVRDEERRSHALVEAFPPALDQCVPPDPNDPRIDKCRRLLRMLVVDRVTPVEKAFKALGPMTAEELKFVVHTCKDVQPRLEKIYGEEAMRPLAPLSPLDRLLK